MSKEKNIKPRCGSDKTICLNMIVKNEAHVIVETLSTIKDYIDYWIICDTGSTDDTKKVITEYFANQNIPGEIIEEPWADHFGYNRTVALKACKTSKYKPDYVWVIDADDLIVGKIDMPKKMNEDSYGLTYGEDFTYMRSQIFNNKLDWEYVGVRHEYPTCRTKQNATNIWIKGNYHIESRRLGDRSKNPKKYLNDALALEKCIKSEPENATRYKFYIGQSYLDYGDYGNSIKWYQERIKDGGWREEVYYSYYRIALAKEKRGDSQEEIEKAYMEAWKFLPSRAEPLYEISKYNRMKGNFEKAYKYAKLGSTIPFPSDQTLFVFKDVYDWKIWDELGISSYYIGKYQESFDAFSKLLKNNTLPDLIRERIEHNRDFNVEHIKADYIEYPSDKISKIKLSNGNNIILTITTCKRYDLFEKTVNSFINCCEDLNLIDKWYCVDDNSDASDREKMAKMYPFFEYVWKTPDQKGHPQSMNIIVDKVINYNYVLHMEDDWQYFEKRNYISEALDIFKDNKKYGQVLFNKNYSETNQSRCIGGGIPKYSNNNIRYLIHEHYAEGTEEYKEFKKRIKNKGDCSYWPHYSLRPSLLKTEVMKLLGYYKETKDHFEYEYAKLYRSHGYISVFLDTISCHHIGKLTYEKNGTNAYKLNGIEQFGNITFDKIIKETKEFNTTESKSTNNRVWIKIPSLDSYGGDLLYNPNINFPNEIFDCNPDAICYNSLGYVKNKLSRTDEFITVPKFPDIYMMIDKTRYKNYLYSNSIEYYDEMMKLNNRNINVFDWIVDYSYVKYNKNFTNCKIIANETIHDIIQDAKNKSFDKILIANSEINRDSLVKDLIHLYNEPYDLLIWTHNIDYNNFNGIISKSGYDKILNEDYTSLIIKKDSSCLFDCPVGTTKLPISITITTCKRRSLFDKMMNSLWEYCKDLNRVKDWYCIDDGSSAHDLAMMKMKWPFLNIIDKAITSKGHESSINLLPKLVSDVTYLFHLEDDWLFTKEFYLEDLISIIDANNADQILCVERWGDQSKCVTYKNYDVMNYEYNHEHPLKPDRNKKMDIIISKKDHCKTNGGWWWPGFSLNPGVWKTSLFKYFPLNTITSDFEYELSLKMNEDGVKIINTKLCHHIGTEKSAYLLNNKPRDYEHV